jgi:hypothetical protein
MRRALSVIGLVVAVVLATAVPATAAPAAVPTAAKPVGYHAAKGIPPFGRAGAAARPDSGPFPPTVFLYADAAQFATAAGTFANITVEQPVVGPQDFHSNAEVAAESADGQQIVEIGWIVDHNLNGDGLPHLFVFHWVDGVGACYNGCGWVPAAGGRFAAGQALPVGATMRFAIQHVIGPVPGWQLSLNGSPFGEFPDSLWNGTYTQIGLAQWFGEVAASASQPPCTQMGDGQFASSSTAAQFSGVGFVNGPATSFLQPVVTNPTLYTFAQTAPNAFRFGGPGSSC